MAQQDGGMEWCKGVARWEQAVWRQPAKHLSCRIALLFDVITLDGGITVGRTQQTRMWVDAKRDGCPAKYSHL